MSLTLRRVLCLLTLTLNFSLFNAAFAQPKSLVNGSSTTEVNELAAALVRTKSDSEQQELLSQHGELLNNSLLAALKSLATPLIQKGEYAEELGENNYRKRVSSADFGPFRQQRLAINS